jgi:hypothetical protein
MALPRSYLAERMEFGGPRFSEELVPGIRSDCRDTRETSFYATKIDRAENSRKIGEERAHCCVALPVRLNRDYEEYRCAGEWRKNGLRNRIYLAAGCAHMTPVHLTLHEPSICRTPNSYAHGHALCGAFLRQVERRLAHQEHLQFEETNVVGNVYFTHYLRWQGRCRDMFLHQYAPELMPELGRSLALATTRVACSTIANRRPSTKSLSE